MPVRSVSIENPVISSPFDGDGITEEINRYGDEVLKVCPVKRDPD